MHVPSTRHRNTRNLRSTSREAFDCNTGFVKTDRILMQSTSAGLVLLSFGSRAASYRKLFEAERLIKEFNPEEPRDEIGRWVAGTAPSAVPTMTTAASVIPAIPSIGQSANVISNLGKIPSLSEMLGPVALEGLTALAATFATATAFLGAYFLPRPEGGAAGSGTLPDYPDIRYFYDEDAGSFGLRADDGQVLFQGKMGGDGLIRTDQDDVVGRNTGGSVIVDIDKIGSVLAAQVDNSATEVDAAAIAQETTDDAKLCPDPEPDRPGGKSPRSIAYQELVSTLVNPEHPIPPGFAVYYFNSATERWVALDDCDQQDGDPVEAKGYGFAKMLSNRIVEPFLRMRFLKQAGSQVDATGGLNIRWYVAEPETASYLRRLFATPKLSKIQVIDLPAPMLKIMFWWEQL